MQGQRRDAFQGKKNIYLCKDCGHGFISLDRDAGTTPFMTECLNCGGFAQSMMYAAPQQALAEHACAFEWVRATPQQVSRMTASGKQHHQMGGLFRSDKLGKAPKKKVRH